MSVLSNIEPVLHDCVMLRGFLSEYDVRKRDSQNEKFVAKLVGTHGRCVPAVPEDWKLEHGCLHAPEGRIKFVGDIDFNRFGINSLFGYRLELSNIENTFKNELIRSIDCNILELHRINGRSIKNVNFKCYNLKFQTMWFQSQLDQPAFEGCTFDCERVSFSCIPGKMIINGRIDRIVMRIISIEEVDDFGNFVTPIDIKIKDKVKHIKNMRHLRAVFNNPIKYKGTHPDINEMFNAQAFIETLNIADANINHINIYECNFGMELSKTDGKWLVTDIGPR